jgi:prepilin-type N-terminal cleavage/methylation domain-containing protein
MRHQRSNTANRTLPAGFTIIECLLSLAITAVLMVALGVALNASAMNYKENEQTFRTVNSARQALTRITAQLRTGHFVNPTAPSYQCSFFTDANENLTYEYRSNDHKLYLITNSNGNAYTLCNNVTGATFTKMPDGLGDCKGVQISLTVQDGDRQRTLVAAAVIRRNLAL